MSHVEIIDLGKKRRVKIHGQAYSYHGYSPTGIEFETICSVALIRDLERIKGAAWLKDEIDRVECADYLEVPLTRFVRRFLPEPNGHSVLDIGSGVGASSLILARLGMNVTAVECDRAFHDVAVRRVQECGFASKVKQQCIVKTAEGLPYKAETFDVIMLSAVMEHVDPQERPQLLQEAWRVLRRQGRLFIHDTPNRLWPYDGHTTGLWLTTWLPWKLRVAYARRYSWRFPNDISVTELIVKGLHPPTYWEIQKHLPAAICLNARTGNDVAFAFGLTDSRERRPYVALTRAAIIWGLKQAGRSISRFGIPPAAILQNLDLCFQKP
jgi:2-polyprenyl-3-methyl-5-hydroxy-6-metoxy-1,4-benzoquinol methylase